VQAQGGKDNHTEVARHPFSIAVSHIFYLTLHSGEFFPNTLVLWLVSTKLLEIQLADVCDSRIAVHDVYLSLAQRRYAFNDAGEIVGGLFQRPRATNGILCLRWSKTGGEDSPRP
jgi:hypothetical protein